MVKRIKNNKKGFTLVEVIVVLVILAILAAISIPALTGYIDEAKDAAAISYGRTVLVAAQTVASKLYATSANIDGQHVSDDEIEKITAVGHNVEFKVAPLLDANGRVKSFELYFTEDGSLSQSTKVISYTIDGGFTVS